MNLGKLEERPKVQPTIGDVGLVYPGKRHLFSGPPEAVKTMAAYIVALQEVRAGGRVILIDLEMGPWDARDRLRELGATETDFERIYYVEPETEATTETMLGLLQWKPTLVVIDAAAGAYTLQELDDYKRRDAEQWANLWVRPFWQNDVATITLDHVVKRAESRGSYAIGSERKAGGVDVHLGFETVIALRRGGRGLYKIHTHKDRLGYLSRPRAAELEIVSEAETHALTWTFRPAIADSGNGWRPTVLMEKVSRYLEGLSEPVSRNQVEANVTGAVEYVRQAIDELVAGEYARELKGPRRSRLCVSITPFRTSSDFVGTSSDEVVTDFVTSSPL
jgi:hypothetical protein